MEASLLDTPSHPVRGVASERTTKQVPKRSESHSETPLSDLGLYSNNYTQKFYINSWYNLLEVNMRHV